MLIENNVAMRIAKLLSKELSEALYMSAVEVLRAFVVQLDAEGEYSTIV